MMALVRTWFRTSIRALCWGIMSFILLSGILLSADESRNHQKDLEIFLRERDLLLIHNKAPEDVRKSLLLHFQSHLLKEDTETIGKSKRDEIYRDVYEKVWTALNFPPRFPDRHSEVRAHFRQTSIKEEVDRFIADFDRNMDDESRGSVIKDSLDDTLNTIKLLQEDSQGREAINKLHEKLGTWIESWEYTELKPDQLQRRLEHIQKVVAAYPLFNMPVGSPSSLPAKIRGFVGKVITAIKDPKSDGPVLAKLNLYLDEMRELEIPWIEVVETEMEKQFSFVSRSVGSGNLVPSGEVGRDELPVTGARLVRVRQLDRDSKLLMCLEVATEKIPKPSNYYLFPDTRLVLEYELSPGTHPAFVVTRNLTMNKRGNLVNPEMPKKLLPNRIFVSINDDSSACLVDAAPMDKCEFLKRVKSYCKSGLDIGTETETSARREEILSLLEKSGLKKILVDDSGKESKNAIDELVKSEVVKLCKDNNLVDNDVSFPAQESYADFDTLFDLHLLLNSERFAVTEWLELLRKLGDIEIPQFKFALKHILNNNYQSVPKPENDKRIFLLTVVPMQIDSTKK